MYISTRGSQGEPRRPQPVSRSLASRPPNSPAPQPAARLFVPLPAAAGGGEAVEHEQRGAEELARSALDEGAHALGIHDDAAGQALNAQVEEGRRGHHAGTDEHRVGLVSHACQLKQARHGLVRERDARHEQVVLLGNHVLAGRVGRVEVVGAVALEHCEDAAASLGDALHMGEVAHHGDALAGHLLGIHGEGVRATLDALGQLAHVVEHRAVRLDELATRVPGVEGRHAQRRLGKVPRLGQGRHLAQGTAHKRRLVDGATAARARHGDTHAALGLDI